MAISVVSYLQYLHDVSRKILQRGGFENILYRKSKSQHHYYMDIAAPSISKYLSQMEQFLRQQPGKGLFVGFGMITGKLPAKNGTSGTKCLTAPLLLCRVEIPDDEQEDEGDGSLQIDWDSLALNHDLITALLEKSEVEDATDIDFSGSERIPSSRLQALSAIESEIDRRICDPGFRSGLLDGTETQRLMEMLREGLPEFAPITPAHQLFGTRVRELDDLANSSPAQFYRHAYYFAATVPNQLSATIALRHLVRECEATGFQNPLLDSLFVGALEERPPKIAPRPDDEKEIREKLSYIPLPLSEPQIEAVIKAWAQDFTYIQGPPGTGKSHTICAIMLMGLLLGKRVLMVSHKKAAVDVVQRKLDAILGAGSIIHLSDSSTERRRLRAAIQQHCQQVRSRHAEVRLEERRRKCLTLFDEADRLNRELGAHRKQLALELERQQRFYHVNNKFIALRSNFADAFGISDAKSIDFRDRPLENRFIEGISKMSQVLQARQQPEARIPRKSWMYLRRFLNATAKQLPIDRNYLNLDQDTASYLTEYATLTNTFTECQAAHRAAASSNLAVLRKLIRAKSSELERTQNELVRELNATITSKALFADSQHVEAFERLIHWTNSSLIEEKMKKIDYTSVTRSFPLWLAEMRHLGNFLPFSAKIFDLVIVDEASQVNIAEIIPAFYRGSSVCVVGDHKQLGLNAAGLFSLNQTFEEIIWNLHIGTAKVPFQSAIDRSLLVSKCSILEFAQGALNLRPVTLNEHFRSHPRLAAFTSDTFYADDGGLLLMQEVYGNVRRPCFRAIEVAGKRIADAKVVREEVEMVLKKLSEIVRSKTYLNDEDLKPHNYSEQRLPSLGIISFLTQQRDFIRYRLDEEFDADEIARHDIFVGTPEEFQGNERNIMFLTFGIDPDVRYAKAFFEDHRRFNVATSRAIDFTYAIYGGVPKSADLIRRYLRHFGVVLIEATDPTSAMISKPEASRWLWTYDRRRCESEFEHRIADHLEAFCRIHRMQLFNQVECCGQKRLDFVIYNEVTDACAAVEVDGPDHYAIDGKSYSEAHLRRIDVLQRAGWRIVHIPYHRWYQRGWLCDPTSATFRETLAALQKELTMSLAR